jgi:hypothetical protein
MRTAITLPYPPLCRKWNLMGRPLPLRHTYYVNDTSHTTMDSLVYLGYYLHAIREPTIPDVWSNE